jgi:outer membrane protein OmpA-like peptidoglycan-associated protein
MRTRSIRVTREGQPSAPAPSASLLITFETNSAQLTPQARKSLEVVGRALKSEKLADFRFSIEGHADPRGTEAANLRLSQARAESVVAYLVDSQSIDRARLKAVGKGQSELMNVSNPIAPENRRVTIKTVTD